MKLIEINRFSLKLFLFSLLNFGFTLFAGNLIAENLYPVVFGGEIVYIDHSGIIVISEGIDTPYEEGEVEFFNKKFPTYVLPEWAYFSEGKVTFLHERKFWFIHLGDEYGMMDFNAKMIIEPRDELIWNIKNGFIKTIVPLRRAQFAYDNAFLLLNLNDSSIDIDNIDMYNIDNVFKYCGDFNDGYAVVLPGDNFFSYDYIEKYNYINTKIELISDTGFDDVRTFSEGKGVVMIDSLWGVVNEKGEFIIKPKFKMLWQFKNGLARFYDGKSFGFINEKSEFQFGQMFISAGDYSCGYALVQHLQNEYHFIDTTGQFINLNFISDRQKNSQKGFSAAGNFSDDLAPVMIDGRWGYINTKGELAIPANYDFAQEFRDGFAQVWKDNEMYIINTKGNEIWTYILD